MRLPGFLSKRLSPPRDPFKEVWAVNVFENIGPLAIPSLMVLLKDDNAVVRSSAIWALESFRRSGYGDEVTISALASALSDPDANVRRQAASALGEFGPKAGVAVPALAARLKDDEKGAEKGSVVFVRAAAARALGRIGPGASAAASRLSALQTNPEPYLRMEATVALWRINRQPSLVLPVLIDALPKTADPGKWEIFQALGEMGADAKDAVTAITEELKSQNSEVRQRAAEALWRIDPKQAPVIVDALVEPLDNPKATSANLFSVVEGVRLLGEIGPEARRAVPALIKLQTHKYPPASNAVAKALLQIDRDGAAKRGIDPSAP
jgi:HEAT repeat protein